MLPASQTAKATIHTPIVFTCPACGLQLSVPLELAGVSAPCPSCAVTITSPATSGPDREEELEAPKKSQVNSYQSAGKPLPSHRHSRQGRRGNRILADANVDQDHLEKKETAKTLSIITLFMLTIALCLAVAWFLSDYIGK